MGDALLETEITGALNEQRALDFRTQMDKNKFILEMKAGLGDVIKADPLKVKFIKEPWHVRFGKGFKRIMLKLFTRF